MLSYRSDDLYLRGKDLKHDVKAYLVVACTGAAVSDIISSELLHVLEHFESLEHSFGTYRERVGAVLEDVSIDKVFDTLVVVSVYCVHSLV